MTNLREMTEHCDSCGEELEIGQIGECDECQAEREDARIDWTPISKMQAQLAKG
jgi:hypothetical protein